MQVCPKCGGRLVGLATLARDRLADRFRRMLWQRARRLPRGRPCPGCRQVMEVAHLPAGDRTLELDLCRHCFSVWFDPSEYEAVPREPPVVKPAMSPNAKETWAMVELERVKHRQRAEAGPGDGSVAWWKYVPAALGCPVEMDAVPLSSQPAATWGLAGLLAAVFLLTAGNLEAVVQDWGFKPAEWSRHSGLTLLTSFLLHGGWLHLLGNLYFLAIFGDNVEDRLGRARFLLLVLASALAGTALHGALEPHGEVPCVGASGGIFGLVAFYSLTFPRARIGMMYWFRWVQMPAWLLLGFYLLFQLLGAAVQVSGFGSVSSLGHLGGIAVGAVAALACRIAPPDGEPGREERGHGAERTPRGEYQPRRKKLD